MPAHRAVIPFWAPHRSALLAEQGLQERARGTVPRDGQAAADPGRATKSRERARWTSRAPRTICTEPLHCGAWDQPIARSRDDHVLVLQSLEPEHGADVDVVRRTQLGVSSAEHGVVAGEGLGASVEVVLLLRGQDAQRVAQDLPGGAIAQAETRRSAADVDAQAAETWSQGLSAEPVETLGEALRELPDRRTVAAGDAPATVGPAGAEVLGPRMSTKSMPVICSPSVRSPDRWGRR